MRILITNDDGIAAEGLRVLNDLAVALAGADNVITVAPVFEQSGVGHCISYSKPLHVAQIGPNRFTVDGSPADCVLAGVFEVMADSPPDLILSGVNNGNNAAQNTLYSGTVGATIEAAMHGMQSIALSQFYGPALENADRFDSARAFGVETVRRILDAGVWTDGGHPLFYNVNFPPVRAADVRGHQITTQGFRDGSPFSAVSQVAPNGKPATWITGSAQHAATAQGTDVHANIAGYIAVTPCQLDITAHSAIPSLQKAFE